MSSIAISAADGFRGGQRPGGLGLTVMQLGLGNGGQIPKLREEIIVKYVDDLRILGLLH